MATKSSKQKYGRKASRKVKRAMHERKHGKLKSGRSGKKVKSRKQAIAIGLAEARRSGAKVPSRRKSRSKSKRKDHSSPKSRSKDLRSRSSRSQGKRQDPKKQFTQAKSRRAGHTDNHYFLEETADRGFAVRAKESERASEVFDTQEEAIERVGELNPDDHPDVEHVRNTSAGVRDKWRSLRGGSDE